MKEFATRSQNLALLHASHGSMPGLVTECFELVDELIDACNSRIDDEYYRTCGVAIVKGKNYALSCYSLMLDGHAQEAGAMARPWWEYMEVLAYFQEDTRRTKQVKSHSLPPAGRLSRKVNANLQGFRKYLNEHAAHRSFSSQATRHIVNGDGTFRKYQKASETVIVRNLRDLFVMLWLFGNEALSAVAAPDSTPFLPLAERMEELRQKGIVEFGLDSGDQATGP